MRICKKERGFSILELSIVLFIGAGLLTTFILMLQNFRLSEAYKTYSSIQAREMVQVRDAASKYVKSQQATMALGQRLEYGVDTLIRQNYLPNDFALRDSGAGPTAGISPFGQPYKIVSIKDALDKKVRTVIYDDGVPKAARLARAGVTRVAASILALKGEIAGRGVLEQKAITGTVAAGATAATGYLNTFANFSVEAWILTPPVEAISMVFLGFPELGDTGVTGTGGPRYTGCALLDGMSGCDHFGFGTTAYYTCVENGSGFIQPTCAAPAVDVRRWSPTAGFALIDTPVGTLTTGGDEILSGGGQEYPGCGPTGPTGQPGSFTTNPTASRYALSSLNNVTALRQLISRDEYYVPFGSSCPQFGTRTFFAGENVMCCIEVVE